MEDTMVQLTQYLYKDEYIDVPGGSCKPPYRCSKCNDRRNVRIADPENKGKTYKTIACDRTGRTVKTPALHWLEMERFRIQCMRGRTAEIRNITEEDGTEKMALFVNQVAECKSEVVS